MARETFDTDFVPFAPAATADEIARDQGYANVPLGEQLLICDGLTKEPEPKRMELFVNGRLRVLDTTMVTVGFVLASNPAAKISDTFFLPPVQPSQLETYLNGSKDGEKGNVIHSNKFIHFIERLGFDWPKGGQIPAEACSSRNWRGRSVVATVVAGDPYYDQATGQEKPGRNNIKLFSYARPSAPGTPQQSRLPGIPTPSAAGKGPYANPKPPSRGATGAPAKGPTPRTSDGLEAY